MPTKHDREEQIRRRERIEAAIYTVILVASSMLLLGLLATFLWEVVSQSPIKYGLSK